MLRSKNSSSNDLSEVLDASHIPVVDQPLIKEEPVPPDAAETDYPPLITSLSTSVDEATKALAPKGENTQPNAVDLTTDIELGVEREMLSDHHTPEISHPTVSEITDNILCPVCKKNFVCLNQFIEHLEREECIKSETVDVVSAPLDITHEQDVPPPEAELQMSTDVDDTTYFQIMDELVRAYLNPSEGSNELVRAYLNPSEGGSSTVAHDQSVSDEGDKLTTSVPDLTPARQDICQAEQKKTLLHCPHCSYTTSWSTNLLSHLTRHGGDKPFKCSLCSYACTTKQRLVHHVISHTRERSGKSTKSGPLEEHVSGNEAYECVMCSQNFTTKQGLIQHQISHTAEPELQCPSCSFATKSKTSMIRHVRIHTGEKPFKCTLCPYAGAQHQRLVEHMRTHSGEKPYKCEQCSFSATTKKGVTRHMKTHTGEKPFKCTLCSFASSQRASLNRHFRRHTGEKPYKCSVCPYAASELKILVCHERIHTGEKPYKCSICSYASTKQCNLVRHMATHEGERLTMVESSQQIH